MGGCYVTAKRTPARTVGGLSSKYRRMCEVYKLFGRDWQHLFDYSDDAMVEMFNHESLGLPLSEKNGYALGKKWMDVTVEMWKEDIKKGLLFIFELYEDDRYPRWWLDIVFKSYPEKWKVRQNNLGP